MLVLNRLSPSLLASFCFIVSSCTVSVAQEHNNANAEQVIAHARDGQWSADQSVSLGGALPVEGTTYSGCNNCPEMVVVPAGSFLMGSPDSEEERAEDEGPQHQVSLKAFAIGKYEVTRGQFRSFVEMTGYRTQAEQDADRGCYTLAIREDGNASWDWTANQNWRNAELYGLEQGDDDHPVLCVSRQDAQAYITWLNETHLGVEEQPYRLPTEAEWEYAARAGSSTVYSYGTAITAMCRYGNGGDLTDLPNGNEWLERIECHDGYAYTAPVGSFEANDFGLHDMHGNVWEWTDDCWHDNYNDAPVNGEVWEEENGGVCTHRVARGGSWFYHRGDLRIAFRLVNSAINRSNLLGIRLVQDLD